MDSENEEGWEGGKNNEGTEDMKDSNNWDDDEK